MCLEGKQEAKEKPGRYKCKKCGAVSKEKKNMCKPQKIKETIKLEDKKCKKDKKGKKDKKKKKGKKDKKK